jgi:branched-chain amino acid aminotransferase
MINLNGSLTPNSELIFKAGNRAFLYGDQLFETILFENGTLKFWEDHYFRMMGAACLLRMEIPIHLNMDFMKEEVLKTITSSSLETKNTRVRLSLFRTDGGLYRPKDRSLEYLIEVEEVIGSVQSESLVIDVFYDHLKPSQPLSNTKGVNSIVSVLSAIFAEENQLDEAIILNTESFICETTSSNIFVVKEGVLYTPSLKSGCVDGIMRRQIFENAANWDVVVVEKEMKTFELIKADEVFLTNSIKGIRSVKSYKKKTYKSELTVVLQQHLANL